MTADTPAPDPADIWRDGALKTAEAAKFVQLCERDFTTVAKEQNWPRRYRGYGCLWPVRVLAAYLDSLPTERKGSAKSQRKEGVA
jgi:hypothetical protein